jgi:hypothetical protein
LKLLKVQWKDGDVITEHHFRGLEQWSETTQAVLATQSPAHGLLRILESDGTFNNPANITIKHLQGTQYQIILENLQGITGKGRIISIFDRRQFDVMLRTTDRDSEGFYNLYLVPVDGEGGESKSTDVTGGAPVLYEPLCRPQTSDELHDGVCVARFKADGASVAPDPAFLPLCFTLNASPQSIARLERINQSMLRLANAIEQYVKALVNRTGLEPIWVFSVELLRLLCRNKVVFSNSSQRSQEYFQAIQSFFDAVVGELKILAAEYKEPKLLGEVHSSIQRLSRPLLSIALDWNMAKPFDVVEDGIAEVVHLLSRFPEGPEAEESIAVKDMVFARGTAYNKLTVHFVEEVTYARERNKLVVKLRDYSTREPSTWDIRLALGGDMPYGSLPQLNNLLKRVGKDEFDFRIEFPGDVLGSGTMRQLVLYLPPPLGENVDTHQSRVTLSMVS